MAVEAMARSWGYRIYHPTLHSCTLRVPMPARRDGERGKMLLIHLDSEGCAFVSEGVLADLELARSSGLSPHQFLVLNVLEDPPPLTVFMPQPDGRPNEKLTASHHNPRSFQQVGERIVSTNPSTPGQIVHWDKRKLYA